MNRKCGGKMNVLSLFDGMSCGQLALNKAGVEYENYFASEIDKAAMSVTQTNFPKTVQLGSVTELSADSLPSIDLLIGGSPCQSISNLGDGSGLEGKSGLFYHYVRLKNSLNPKHFILENVDGNKKAIDEITELLEVEPILFNSNLLSGQNRARYYWTNIKFELPANLGIHLKDILDNTPKETCRLTQGRLKWITDGKGVQSVAKRYASIDPVKASCLTARSDASWNCNYVTRQGELTKLTCEEYEKLQTVPVGYTSSAKTYERYRMLGNGWTVDVVAHILKSIKHAT